MYLRLNTNSTCNLNCKHCYYKEKVGFDWKVMNINNTYNIINQAQNIWKNNLNIVIMWWWEPFLYRHIFELLDFLSIKKIPTSITTNALLLDNILINKLKKYNVLLNISLEWNKEYNDYIRWNWTFNTVVKNINNLIKNSIDYSINFTLTKNNIISIPFLIKLFSPTAKYITFSRYIPYFEDKSIIPLNKEDYLVIEKILDKYKNNKLRYRQESFLSLKNNWKNNYTFNVSDLKSLYILPDLSIYPAWNLIDYKLGNLKDNTLIEILNNWKLEDLYNPEKLNWTYCNTCTYKYNCSWDRWVAYFYSKNFWWDDIQCPYYDKK